MADVSVKEEARQLVEGLPEDATWADLANVVAMRARLAQARRERAEGRMIPLEAIEKEFGFTG
ncbi:MAG: hypothetical protein IPH65_02270 [Dehalococcoidia bacterium]|uniref:hypothetical protein n=1 Tax=Candidatus Amarobacter glycogenicus TaxID=3140699 RepID=UPI003136DF35|nr:hypothetical protein [Dehalococcoidia bacterium]MBK7124740.1 hypothetical protein [Dehalococcoidia bacterium]MBK9546915.1 hypothetical protein [Dehalococcoidia bacterium]MCC6266771.1 hypothetical protein [Dehalococcoidia bacterium]